MLWIIERPENFSRCLKDLSPTALKNFDARIREMEQSENPIASAELVLTKRHGRCFTTRLTGSDRLAFRFFRDYKKLQLITTGDHKKIYGKDKRS